MWRAWMDEVVSRSRALARDGTSARLHVADMVCSQSPPVGDKPRLMTFREVETVFHEFGHALQHMLTKEDEGLVSGIRGIEWDAVELPSQFMENRCYQRGTLMSLAKHYETGETLPEVVYLKLLAARTFRAGIQSLRQIKFASTDLELHGSYIPGGSESIFDIDRRVSEKTSVIAPLPEDRFLCGFSHSLQVDMQQDTTVTSGQRCYQLMPFQHLRMLDWTVKRLSKRLGASSVKQFLLLEAENHHLRSLFSSEGVNLLRHNGLLVAATASA